MKYSKVVWHVAPAVWAPSHCLACQVILNRTHFVPLCILGEYSCKVFHCSLFIRTMYKGCLKLNNWFVEEIGFYRQNSPLLLSELLLSVIICLILFAFITRIYTTRQFKLFLTYKLRAILAGFLTPHPLIYPRTSQRLASRPQSTIHIEGDVTCLRTKLY